MPAIITHDMFGRDFFERNPQLVGSSAVEHEAFLLGNQGPDPLLYARANPRIRAWRDVGGDAHQKVPSALLAALKHNLVAQPADVRIACRAWAHGFLCHYVLDSTVHPFVYATIYTLCDAGIDGLSRGDSSRVHNVIESDLDEMVLSVKRHETIQTFRPYERILQADDETVEACSTLLAQTVHDALGEDVPRSLYARALATHRNVQRFFYAPGDRKRDFFTGFEQHLTGSYSAFDAMAHRPIYHETSPYENADHAPWINPFTHEEHSTSFWELYRHALDQSVAAIRAFDRPDFDKDAARNLTHGINFSGEPVEE